MHCEAQEAEGTQRPSVVWRRRDGLPLQKNRVRALGGNITIDTLRRQDFGIYQCVASNEVSTRRKAARLRCSVVLVNLFTTYCCSGIYHLG